MKKIFSLLAAVLFAGSMMAEKAEVTFDFTNPSGLGITAPAASAGTELTNATITVDEVSMTFTSGSSTATRVWNSQGVYDLRVYKNGGSLTLTAQEDITYVKFEGNNVKFDEVAEGSTVWNGTAAKTLTFSANATCNINKVIVGFGKLPTELKTVKDSTTWDFSKITANTANALYGNDGIKLTDESTPSKNDEVIYADYTEDFMTFAEDFDKAAIAFKGEYPIRKNQYCQAGTLHFKAEVAGTIVVKFSDTGSSASATAVKRYLVVNGDQTEYWTSRENNGADAPYAAQLNVVSDKIAVPAGDVTITGSSAITMYSVTFVPAEAEEPVLADPTNCAEAAAAALSVEKNNDLYNDGKEYTIEGYVTAIQTAFSATNKNISFWMADAADGGKVLEAYRAVCETAEDAPAVGDKVAVTGKLTKYNTTPEFAPGCTFVIKEKSAPAVNLGAKTIAEFLALKNVKDTCVLTGVVDSIANTTYGNLYLVEGTDTLYVYGVLTPAGESKKFETLDVAVGDKLTIKAVYSEYNGAPQASNAIFVSVEKAQGIENIVLTEKVEKVLVDGVIYIVRDGKMFNLQGAQVR